MTKAVVHSCSWALPWLVFAVASAHAQSGVELWDDEYGDDYDAYFGTGEEDGHDGPASLEEARQQGRSYRIGGNGRPGPGPGPTNDAHVVREGDTLWDISQRYYHDPWQWPRLWSYNPEITNPHWIYPMDLVRLTPEALQQDLAVAKAVTGEKGAGMGLGGGEATAGMLSGTEQAPSVVVPGRMFQKPGTIFLRDEAYLDREALDTVGQVIGGNEEHMFLSPSDQVYVRFKEGQDVRAGQSYTLFRPIHSWERNPGEDESRGRLIRIQGTVVIRSYDRQRNIARGVITEALDPIERGFFVAKLDRRFDFVEPQRNEANVVARIVASSRPRELLSYGDVVFLDVGEGHGIKPGNRFFVVRRGDEWLDGIVAEPTELGNIVEVPEYDPSVLPKEVVAELRVLKVRKNTTITLVTRSDYDVQQGEVAEMRVGF